MPRACKCKKGKCKTCGLCPKCKCKCSSAPDVPDGCACHRARCRRCNLCVGHKCTCAHHKSPAGAGSGSGSTPARAAKRQRVSTSAANHVAVPADGRCTCVPGDNAVARDFLTYVTTALPEPPHSGKRKRAAWDARINRLSAGSGRISAESLRSDDTRRRVVSLFADMVSQLLAVTVEEPELVIDSIARRLQGPSRAKGLHTNVLTRVVTSLHRMLSHNGLPSDVRATIAAVASAVPQPVFTDLLGVEATRRSSLLQRTHRNGTARRFQGGLRRVSERVGLGWRARLTASANRTRLEDGVPVATNKRTRFKPAVVKRAVSWLAAMADISSNWKRKVLHGDKRVDIPSMLLRQRPSTLFAKYVSEVQHVIGETNFRRIIDRAFTVTKGRRAAMDYISLTFGERNMDAIRDLVKNQVPSACVGRQ